MSLGLLWADFAYYGGVCDVAAAVGGNGVKVYGAEGVGSLDALFGGVSGVGTDALTQSSEFVGIGCVPYGLVHGVSAQLAIFHHGARCCIKDGGCQWRRVGGSGGMVGAVCEGILHA